jgi:hypothetical protein
VFDRGPAAPVSAAILLLDSSEVLGASFEALLGGSRRPSEVLVVDQADAREAQEVLDRHSGATVPLRQRAGCTRPGGCVPVRPGRRGS